MRPSDARRYVKPAMLNCTCFGPSSRSSSDLRERVPDRGEDGAAAAWTISKAADNVAVNVPPLRERLPMTMSELWSVLDTQGLGGIIGLSLAVSASAAVLAGLLGTPLGAALAVYPIPGRRAIVLGLHALLGLPPVVVGLALYLLLSRSGSLGGFGLLFTPGAMILAQTMLALPIVAALSHSATTDLWAEYGPALQIDSATRLRTIPHLLTIAQRRLLTAFLAGFGRTISEVGAILIVGGNIAGYTRTMTTAIVLETSMGNLAVALGLGLILIGISVVVSIALFGLSGRRTL